MIEDPRHRHRLSNRHTHGIHPVEQRLLDPYDLTFPAGAAMAADPPGDPFIRTPPPHPAGGPLAKRNPHMFHRVPGTCEAIKRELQTYRAVIRHPRTPLLGRCCLAVAILYAALSFDLIPDFLPIVGHLDDVIVIPLLFAAAAYFVPQEVITECRRRQPRR